MKKRLLFAAIAGFGLVSASPPDAKEEAHPPEAEDGYPTCSRTVTDRCIQRHERGMRRERHASHERHGPRHERHARHEDHDPPVETAVRTHYPPCSRTVRDRCNQLRGRGGGENRQLAMRIRRAGERG